MLQKKTLLLVFFFAHDLIFILFLEALKGETLWPDLDVDGG